MNKPTAFKHKKPDNSAGFLLWKIMSLWQQKLTKILEKFGINQTQFAIAASLKWLEEHGEETTQNQIAQHAKIDKMTVSKAIRKLEKSNFIVRNKSNADARAFNIEFTEHGNNIINTAIVAIENADEEFFSCLTKKEINLYKSLTILVIKGNDV